MAVHKQHADHVAAPEAGRTHVWITSAGAILAMVAIVAGAIVAVAGFASSKADAEDTAEAFGGLELRLRAIEANDVRQTVILERIERDVAGVAQKLDQLRPQ